jgi:hypothetical protein
MLPGLDFRRRFRAKCVAWRSAATFIQSTNSRPMDVGDVVEVEVTGVGRLSMPCCS